MYKPLLLIIISLYNNVYSANLSNPGSLINNFWDNGNGGDGSNWSPFLNFIGNSNKIAVVASPPLDKPPKIHYAYSGLDRIVKYFSCAMTYKNNGKVASETCSNPATVSASILSASAPGITMMSDGTLVICYAVVNSQANCFTSVDGITFTPKGMAALSLGAPAPYSIGTSYNVVIRNIFQFSDMKASGTGWSFFAIPPGLAFNSDPVSMVIKAAGVSTIILVGIGYDGGIYWTKKNLLSDNFTPMIKLTSTTGIALGSPTLLGINPSIDKQSYTGVRLIAKFVNSDGYSYITFDGSAWTTTWLPLNKKQLCSDLTSVQVGSSYRFYGYDEKKGAIYTWDAV